MLDGPSGVNELREKAKSFEANLSSYKDRAEYESLLNQVTWQSNICGKEVLARYIPLSF